MKDTETDVSVKLGLARLGLAMKKQEEEDQKKWIHDIEEVDFSKYTKQDEFKLINNKNTHV